MATRLTVTLTMRSPLHIGGETQINTDAKRPLLKQREGYPYIPATTLKGRLRHTLEQLVGIRTGTPRAEGMYQPLSSTDYPDVVSYLFGSPWLEGKLFFSDLMLVGPDEVFVAARGRPSTTTRMGVGINARRRVAQDNVLYSTELFAAGMSLIFEGDLTAYLDDLDSDEQGRCLALITAGLRAVECIGSSRSRGLGWCTVSVTPDLSEETIRSALTNWIPAEVSDE